MKICDKYRKIEGKVKEKTMELINENETEKSKPMCEADWR